MHSRFVLLVVFAFIGFTLSAAVGTDLATVDASSHNASPERNNDVFATAELFQAQSGAVKGDGGDFKRHVTQSRSRRYSYYDGYPYYHQYYNGHFGGYPIYGGYPIIGGYYPQDGSYNGWYGNFIF